MSNFDSLEDDLYNDDLYDDDEDTMENVYLTFKLGENEYGIEVKNVIEITGLKAITEVPDMPYYMKGIINLRGKIIPLVDVRLRFDNPEREYTERTCVIMVSMGTKLVGLIVDAVSEVIRIADEQLESPPTVGSNGTSRYIKAIGKIGEDVKLILHLEEFLNNDDVEKILDSSGSADESASEEAVAADSDPAMAGANASTTT